MSSSSAQIVGALTVGAVGIGVSAAIYAMCGSNGKVTPIVDLNQQTVNSASDENGRVSALLKEDKQLIEYLYEDARTLYQSFRRGAKLSGNGDCLGYRKKSGDSNPFVWIKYNEVIERAQNLAQGFLEKGISPGQETFIGIYSLNRPEWIIAEQACYVYNMVSVPLYDTLGADACSYVIKQAEIPLVICDKNSRVEALLAADTPTLRVLVTMENPSSELIKRGQSRGVVVIRFEDLEKIGRQSPQKTSHTPPSPEDLCTICYTSGTTGTPKGVMLTHRNLIADCTAPAILKRSSLSKDDIMISFLPLAHMFERLLENCCYMLGAKVGFYGGDIKLLPDDLKELKPTVLPVVPRLLNRIYDKTMDTVSKSKIKKYIFNMALSAKEKQLEKKIIRNDTIWDKLVFHKIRDSMGGRLRLIISGSAPLSEHILTFVRASMGCVVLEGYGQTECVAACSVTLEGDHIPGHVGAPLLCNEIKLVDVEDMKYFAVEGKGEVCVRGPNVFKGYFKDPEKTAETLDEDGWLHTGDIGQWTKQGTLKLIDRKKHIFKLAQGEYIAPEKVENVYMRSRFVSQVYVHGDSLQAYLVAIVVPDPEVLPKHVEKEFGLTGSMADLCKDERVKKLILEDMVKEGRKNGLCSFEQVKEIVLHAELFSVENGLLTPTFKSKRPALKDFFKDQIAMMYKTFVQSM